MTSIFTGHTIVDFDTVTVCLRMHSALFMCLSYWTDCMDVYLSFSGILSARAMNMHNKNTQLRGWNDICKKVLTILKEKDSQTLHV